MTRFRPKKIKCIPKGWISTEIGQICQLVGGGTPSRKNPQFFGGKIPWFTPTEISKTTLEKVSKSREMITELGLQKSSAKLIPKNAVLLTSRASIGYVAIADSHVTTNQGFVSFVCSKSIDSHFLAYWLWKNRSLLIANAKGSIFKEISKPAIRKLQIAIPPITEQKLIVSRIESIFAQINATLHTLETTLSLLEQQKQSVLNDAFKGALIKTDSAIMSKWTKTPLSDIALVTQGQSPPSSNYNREKRGMPFFQGKANFGLRHPVPEVWCDKPRKVAKKGDILISVRAPVGPVNICGEDCGIGRGLASIRSFSKINPMYLFYHLLFLEADIAAMGTGTTFKAITGNQLRSVILNVAPLDEQGDIVSRIELLFSKINDARQALETSLSLLEQHRLSVLNYAFKGGFSKTDTAIVQ